MSACSMLGDGRSGRVSGALPLSAALLAVAVGTITAACGTLRGAAYTSVFSDEESACHGELGRCVERCRSGNGTSCDVLAVLIAEDDAAFSKFRAERGDPPQSVGQLNLLHGDLDRICSDGLDRACRLREVLAKRIAEVERDRAKGAEKPLTAAKTRPVSPGTKCDPLRFVDPQEAYEGQERPYGSAKEVADLDGDGQAEVEVDYPTSNTSSGMTLLTRTDDASCFKVIYAGPGGKVKSREHKTRGWLDVEIGTDVLTDHGRGSAIVLMAFDGTKYRWKRALECRSFSEPDIKSEGCDELLEQYNPDSQSPLNK